MKTSRPFCLLIVLLFVSMIFCRCDVSAVAGDAADAVHYSKYDGDYYLTRDDNGVAHLKVKEDITVDFSESSDNSFCRRVSFLTFDKKNRVLSSLDENNIEVLVNGVEKIPDKIEEVDVSKYGGGYYEVCVEGAESLDGEQSFTFEYELENVIVDLFGKEEQQFFWVTRFGRDGTDYDAMNIKLHMSTNVMDSIQSDAFCVVEGMQYEQKCAISRDEDGFSFVVSETGDLGEVNFGVYFVAGTFRIITHDSYLLIYAMIVFIILAIAIIVAMRVMCIKANKMRKLYLSLPVVPQYQPPEDQAIHVAEGKQIYLKKVESSYTATLLELVVSKKISIVKQGGNNDNWVIHFNVAPNEAHFSSSQLYLLEMLAGTYDISYGKDIVIKKHSRKVAKFIAKYAKYYRVNAQCVLDQKGYLVRSEMEVKRKIYKSSFGVIAMMALKLFACIVVAPLLLVFLLNYYNDWSNDYMVQANVVLIGYEFVPLLVVVLVIIVLSVRRFLYVKYRRFTKYTEKGIKLAKYLEGLELYIKMAERDRIQFLQSVEGADTSATGMVKLDEELLPWASLFGLEDSWMRELDKYYEVGDDTNKWNWAVNE